MQQNKYDDETFFNKYHQMARSQQGLEAAGEWHTLKSMLPDFKGKRLLDLGCGYGWHCIYAMEQGAKSAVGVDISEKMLQKAREMNTFKQVEYQQMPIESIQFPEDSFDIVLSSLAFHYVQSFEDICRKVSVCLAAKGDFIFSVEHPVFTAYGTQDWYRDESGEIKHWPVDGYFTEGVHHTQFLGEEVIKYHKTLTTYLNTLLQMGFEITGIVEPQPNEHLLATVPGMSYELRRPMMLLVSCRKK
ncbi:class I SAM-dependent methyltransferase [Zophobihabitans entericus]|uniref:Class I SAM-dependent methyltransferase n=1 Tax=Zophobihabitans entericus TaxID=1635327 RepID=A0A6G9ICT9_9GAMM|nr:class I SAM-dependent methyltransferase [Zophobihabitans entericus]QIQ22051.1 class I SAM-dependent methyltransferase [Zophobihabitans entericus]